MAVVILEPPAAPTTSLTLFVLSARTAGHMEDIGRFPGLMKLAGEGGMPNALVILGEEKSSISSLNKIPVLFPVTPEPNLKNEIFLFFVLFCFFFFFFLLFHYSLALPYIHGKMYLIYQNRLKSTWYFDVREFLVNVQRKKIEHSTEIFEIGIVFTC